MEVCRSVDLYVKRCTEKLENDLKKTLLEKEAAILERDALRKELDLKNTRIAALEKALQAQ
jgi:hypothetical protein